MHPTAEGQGDCELEEREPKQAGREFPLWILFTLFVFSGFAALIYQVMWMRSFSLVFGSTTRAASIVLAAFFFGMALGNWLGGRFARSRRGALLGYAIAEGAIAAGALLVIPWLALYHNFYPTLYQAGFGATSLTLMQMGLAFLAMAPPCVAMGATLPLISRAIVTRTDHLGRRVGAAYALNTLGATGGALLAGFFLPVWLGVRNTIALAAAISAVSGIAALALWYASRNTEPEASASTEPTESTESSKEASGETREEGVGLLLVFAAVSGFGTLALEVFFTRLLLNFVDSSVYTFALVLAIFLLSLALGSALVSVFVDRLRSPWSLTAWTASGGALVVMASPSIFSWVWTGMPPPMRTTEWGYLAWLCGVAIVVIAPGVILLGTILPALWKTTRDVRATGQHIGRLTSANTLAAVAGSLAAGFVLIPTLGVARGIALIGALYGGLALLAIARAGSRRRWIGMAALTLALTGVWSQQPARLEPVHLGTAEKLLGFYEGESGSVSVIERPMGLWMRLNNFYLLGSTASGVASRRLLGELGLLLHPDPKQVAFIGVATGISMSPILDFSEVERVSAMEIVPGVLRAARDHFSEANDGVLEDPRVSVIMADGRNHLFGTHERFDVVVSDLFVPWQAGTGYLYTTEHFEIVRSRLKPGGVFLVWLQMDQLSRRELQIIAGTFVDVFDDSEFWLNHATPGWPLVALVGWQEGGAPRKRCKEALEALEGEDSETRPARRAECMFAGEAIRTWAQAAPRNTDDHPILEFKSGLGHFGLSGAEVSRTMAEFGRMRRWTQAR